MERDWKQIFDHYDLFEDDGRDWITDLLYDDGIFEALWDYVVNLNREDEGLCGNIAWGSAVDMLLDIGLSTADVCEAMVMTKESFSESLSLAVDATNCASWKQSVQDIKQHINDNALWYTFDGTLEEHELAVDKKIQTVAMDCKIWCAQAECWGPLRLLHSVLARAIRGNVNPGLIQRGCQTALDTIENLKRQGGYNERMKLQLEREQDRWYQFLVEVSVYTQRAGPGNSGPSNPGPPADPCSVRNEGFGGLAAAASGVPCSITAPQPQIPGLSSKRVEADLQLTRKPRTPQRRGQRDANAREVERLLVDAAVQGEQQLRDHLLALVAPDLRADSKQTLQEFHQIKCRVTDPGGVGALLRFGESLARWVATPEGLGGHDRHLAHVCKGLRAFADGLDEGLGAEEKHDTVIRAFATVGSKPGFCQPRNTALVLGDIVECLDHAVSSAGPVSSAASRAACILSSILTGGYPGQEATDADAVSTFAALLRRVDSGAPPLQKFFHLLTRMQGKPREATAHVILVLLDCIGDQKDNLETVCVLLRADKSLQQFLREGFLNAPGPWRLRLGLRLRRALRDVPDLEVFLMEQSRLTAELRFIQHDQAFLLAAMVVEFGGPLSETASAILYGIQPGWLRRLEGLSPFRFMQEIVAAAAPMVLEQGSSSLSVEDAAVLLVVLLRLCLQAHLRGKRRLAVVGLFFLIASDATLQHQRVKDAEQMKRLAKGMVSIASAFLENCDRMDSLVGGSGVWSPDVLEWLYQVPQLWGLVVAGLACRCLVQPSRNGVSLGLFLACNVLSKYLEPQKLQWLVPYERDDVLVVLESVLGLLTKGRPHPTLADPHALQAIRGMPDLVMLIRKYKVEAASAGMSDVVAVVDVILQHLGVARCL